MSDDEPDFGEAALHEWRWTAAVPVGGPGDRLGAWTTTVMHSGITGALGQFRVSFMFDCQTWSKTQAKGVWRTAVDLPAVPDAEAWVRWRAFCDGAIAKFQLGDGRTWIRRQSPTSRVTFYTTAVTPETIHVPPDVAAPALRFLDNQLRRVWIENRPAPPARAVDKA